MTLESHVQAGPDRHKNEHVTALRLASMQQVASIIPAHMVHSSGRLTGAHSAGATIRTWKGSRVGLKSGVVRDEAQPHG